MLLCAELIKYLYEWVVMLILNHKNKNMFGNEGTSHRHVSNELISIQPHRHYRNLRWKCLYSLEYSSRRFGHMCFSCNSCCMSHCSGLRTSQEHIHHNISRYVCHSPGRLNHAAWHSVADRIGHMHLHIVQGHTVSHLQHLILKKYKYVKYIQWFQKQTRASTICT